MTAWMQVGVDVVLRRQARRLTVAGSGSNVCIQEALLDRVPALQRVVGVDFPGVVEVAAQRLINNKVG